MNSPKRLELAHLKIEDRRNQVHDPFYSSRAWRRVRGAYKAAHPVCEECEKNGKVTPMKAVDHIKPRREGGADFDWDNLQSLCQRCHDQKSSKEGKAIQYGTNKYA